ncbi:hypothetical protein DM860_007050 [Cuscuta australis]|uniref:ATPase AAA-type core domain-containing protein n=1 Tax=Cuscuta australis TaxID=267555 RepID=A0A328E9M8_9ASTE|nr:hypothetical protein DM860_007050 [Cuscuta australis]
MLRELHLKSLGKHPVFKWILSVTRDHVSQVVSTTTGQPASWLRLFINPPTCKSYELMRKFSGHKQAVAAVSYTFKRRYRGVNRKQKPLCSFLVVDTSGLYMEEFARSLSKMIFDSSDALIRINMSECAGSASSGNDIEKLFDGVRRRPCVVIIFENIERANSSSISILKQILRSGYASDESGNEINFTQSIIFVLLQGLKPFYMKVCTCMCILKSSPFKAYLRATSSSSSDQDRCCFAVLKEARDHVDTETWELVDDVALFGSQIQFASCFLMSYTRCILREMAKNFCSGRLIIYPSEVALEVFRRRAKNIDVSSDLLIVL